MSGETRIADVIEPTLLERMIAERFVSVSEHRGLSILNYTQRAQYGNEWNDATLTCRGLIIDADGVIVARPFRKFFNLSQMAQVPDGVFVAHEKLDGSLGIVYPADDGPAVSTRGSFVSAQAVWATGWLRDRWEFVEAAERAIDDGLTLLVEIIYPANRIVVDYGERAELVLLACIDNATGRDVARVWPGKVAARYESLDLDAIASMDADGEGFVLLWEDGTRAKVKFPEYLRLHKLLCGVTDRRIWEVLAAGQDLDELLGVVPDEFHAWATSVAERLRSAFASIESVCRSVLRDVPESWSRKEQAEVITTTSYPGVVFAMLDGKDHASHIWKLVRPEHAGAPFVDDPDGISITEPTP